MEKQLVTPALIYQPETPDKVESQSTKKLGYEIFCNDSDKLKTFFLDFGNTVRKPRRFTKENKNKGIIMIFEQVLLYFTRNYHKVGWRMSPQLSKKNSQSDPWILEKVAESGGGSSSRWYNKKSISMVFRYKENKIQNQFTISADLSKACAKVIFTTKYFGFHTYSGPFLASTEFFDYIRRG